MHCEGWLVKKKKETLIQWSHIIPSATILSSSKFTLILPLLYFPKVNWCPVYKTTHPTTPLTLLNPRAGRSRGSSLLRHLVSHHFALPLVCISPSQKSDVEQKGPVDMVQGEDDSMSTGTLTGRRGRSARPWKTERRARKRLGGLTDRWSKHRLLGARLHTERCTFESNVSEQWCFGPCWVT